MLKASSDSKLTHNSEKILLVLCGLIIATILLHIGFLENKFIDGDDLIRVVQNPLIRDVGLTGLFHDIKGFFLFQYPSFLLTYFWGIIFSMWGLNHIWFHLISFLIHAACVGLLFLLLIKLTGKIIPSVIGAFFLGFHPFHCETVNWISHQDMILSVLLGLLYLYLSFSRRQYTKILSVIALLFAIFFSPISILFVPGRFFLIDGKKRTLFGWDSFVLFVGLLAAWGDKVWYLFSHAFPFTKAPDALFYFIRGLLLPWKIHFMLPVLPSSAPFTGIIVLILIITTGVIAFKLRSRELGALFLCFCSIWLLHTFSTRFNGGYSYFPMFWMSLAIGMGFAKISMDSLLSKSLIFLIAIIVFSSYGFLSYKRNLAWRNTGFLLEDSLGVSPSDGWLLSMLGHYKASFLEKEAAEKYLKRVNQTSARILCLKAKAYHLLHESGRSFDLFGELFKTYPEMKKSKYCLFDYAVLNVQMSHPAEAKKLYREILGIDPYFIYAWHDLGSLFLEEHNSEGGANLLIKVLGIAPTYRPTLENLAYDSMKRGEYAKAARYLRVALKSTSCHDTQRYYREWLKALKEKKIFGFASLQWANLTPPG